MKNLILKEDSLFILTSDDNNVVAIIKTNPNGNAATQTEKAIREDLCLSDDDSIEFLEMNVFNDGFGATLKVLIKEDGEAYESEFHFAKTEIYS